MRFVRLRRLLQDARIVLRGELVHRVDDLEAVGTAADHDDHARHVAHADEDMHRPRRAVHVVPGLQVALLALDHEQALTGDDEEVLLAALAVVEAPLTRADDLDAEAELPPLLPAFEVGVLPAFLASNPRGVARVEHEPALPLGNEPRVRLLQLGLGDCHGLTAGIVSPIAGAGWPSPERRLTHFPSSVSAR